MLDSITPDSIFVEIMMEEGPSRAFLLVEGPDEDAIFFGHVNPDIAMIVCGGKKNVLGAAALAEENGHNNVYGLIDSDFDRILGLDRNYPAHVVATSAYDLVADLVATSPEALRRILSAHASPAVSTAERATGDRVDELVYALTSKASAVRLASMRNKYPLKFKGYDFSPVVDPNYKPVHLDQFVHHAASRSPHFTVDGTVIEAANVAFVEVGSNRHNSGGHDIVSASTAILRKAGAQVSGRTIAGTLIAVASCGVLASLQCLKELAAVARTDSGVELFDCMAA